MKFKTAGGPYHEGDNIIDRDSSGASSGGISNEPAFPNNNATNPSGQGDSRIWGGPESPTPPSGDAVPQYALTGGAAVADIGTGTPEQAFAKPTDSPSPNALGPGMSSRG